MWPYAPGISLRRYRPSQVDKFDHRGRQLSWGGESSTAVIHKDCGSPSCSLLSAPPGRSVILAALAFFKSPIVSQYRKKDSIKEKFGAWRAIFSPVRQKHQIDLSLRLSPMIFSFSRCRSLEVISENRYYVCKFHVSACNCTLCLDCYVLRILVQLYQLVDSSLNNWYLFSFGKRAILQSPCFYLFSFMSDSRLYRFHSDGD